MLRQGRHCVACNVCKAVDRKRAHDKRRKKKSKLLENSPERMNDAKRFVVCFPLSAKLDYRFVVQVIRFFAVVHVVLCLRRKNIIYIVVSLSCHTRHQIPTHQTQYTFIRNAFAFGYCFALFTRSTLDLFVCLFVLFPVIFIYLYVVSTQSS